MKRLALLDWDGTVRRGFTIVDWATYLVTQGALPSRVADKIRVVLTKRLESGNLSHDEAVAEAAALYADALKGTHKEVLTAAAIEFHAFDSTCVFPMWFRLRATLSQAGLGIVIVSGAPQEPLEAHRDSICDGTILPLEIGVTAGALDGRIVRNPGVADVKRRIVHDLLASGDAEVVVGIGNSSSDIALFEEASCVVVVDNPALYDRSAFHVSSGDTEEQEVVLRRLSTWLLSNEPA